MLSSPSDLDSILARRSIRSMSMDQGSMNRDDLMSAKTAFGTLRLIASFALLGAVLAGVALAWVDADLRAYGAAIGGSLAVLGKATKII